MRPHLNIYRPYQVFLNYPFDSSFSPLSSAMSFAVIAGGLIPVCAYDLTTPDRPRLEMLVEAIGSCNYSAHDLSQSEGEGRGSLVRMNMPLEMGMALFHAINTQRRDHRCFFFVSDPHDYKAFASDLAGLDPKVHNKEEKTVLTEIYDWLRGVVPAVVFSSQPTIEVLECFEHFKCRRAELRGSAKGGRPSHSEERELMYQVCAKRGWWDWRDNRMGKEVFPEVPLAYK